MLASRVEKLLGLLRREPELFDWWVIPSPSYWAIGLQAA